jgi:16S rRNA (guanine527-N7)-methyltransferase
MIRYFWLLLMLHIAAFPDDICYCWYRNKNDNTETNINRQSDGFVIAAFLIDHNKNMHRRHHPILEQQIPLYRVSTINSQQNRYLNQPSFFRRTVTLLSSESKPDDIDASVQSEFVANIINKDVRPDLEKSSAAIAAPSLLSPLIEPTSDIAKELCTNTLQMTHAQYQQILHFVTLIMEWNERINLISRKDCTPSTIFTRHILPSLVGGRIMLQTQEILQQSSDTNPTIQMIDVGTGGGFPGIPLAIQYPQVKFVLADSITKKIAAVQDMIDQLQLSNVQTYNGRVEEYFTTVDATTSITTSRSTGDAISKFDIVTGRSVTALPQFCSWIKDLVKPDGHLVYWIGGHIDEMIQEHMIYNISIQEYLSQSVNIWNDNFDKRVVIVPASGVRIIAASIPESQFQQQLSKSVATTRRSRTASSSSSSYLSSSLRSQKSRRDDAASATTGTNNNKLAKGAWRKRNDPDQTKQRGYENFQRYTSSVVSNPSKAKLNSDENPHRTDSIGGTNE